MKKLICVSVLSLGACGGGGSSSTSSTAPPTTANKSAGGIWQTQFTVASGATAGDAVNAQAIVTESGQYYYAAFNTTNGCAEVGFGTLTVNGSNISGTGVAAIVTETTIPGVLTNCVYPDGTTSGTSTLAGTVAERSSLTVTESDVTSSGTALPSSTNTWTYSALYSEPSSLSKLAGNYTDGSDTVSIDSNGVIFEQITSTGCVINGQVSIINALYNAYSFSFTYASCTGANAGLNGVTATGIGTLDDLQTPNKLIAGLQGNVNGQLVVVVESLPKQ